MNNETQYNFIVFVFIYMSYLRLVPLKLKLPFHSQLINLLKQIRN